MKQFQIIILTLFIGLSLTPINAQISNNPLNVLSEKLLQNELLSNRFLKNFIFIKTNTFKKKCMSDMDKSIALFDSNLSYIILHLPYDIKVKEDFLKLQNFWNIYRINITNFEKDNYKSLVNKTQRLNKYITQLNKDIFTKHPEYAKYKKSIETQKLAVENAKEVNKIAYTYVLKNALNYEKFNDFSIDFSAMLKNLKKIKKFKKSDVKTRELVLDLKTIMESIKNMTTKEIYNPKMLYAYDFSYTNKTFKLLKHINKTNK